MLHQLVMAALFRYPAVIYHQDRVGVAYRGQAVGDHKTGPSLHEPAHRLLDLLFRSGVHIGGASSGSAFEIQQHCPCNSKLLAWEMFMPSSLSTVS